MGFVPLTSNSEQTHFGALNCKTSEAINHENHH